MELARSFQTREISVTVTSLYFNCSGRFRVYACSNIKGAQCFNCLDLQIKSKAEEGNSFMACVVCELLHASTAASTDLSRLLLLLDEQKNCRREGIISLPARPCQMRVPTFKAVLH